MTVSSISSLMPASVPSFKNTEQFHRAVRAQLAQDIEVLFTYAKLPSPLMDACRYVMTGQGKTVRPLLVASVFASVTDNNNISGNANKAEASLKSDDA